MTDETFTPEQRVGQLLTLLDVEEIDRDLYRGARQPGGVGRVFGGQVVAQALAAAQRSTEAPKQAHSLHAYFMRGGDEDFPIIYRVVRDFDGRSFATRRVVAMQKGEPILSLTASFQNPANGLHHQCDAMPDVPAPDTLQDEAEALRANADRLPEQLRRLALRPRVVDMRPVSQSDWERAEKRPPWQASWFRVPAPIDDDPALHILAYVSDMKLLGTSIRPHGFRVFSPQLATASLDHAMWFHEPFRVDEWLLYVNDSPWTGHGRGFNRGSVYSADGRLVASTAQEGMIRVRDPKA